MSGTGFDLLREAMVQAGMPGISIALALKIFQARQKDGGCNVKANATCNDVAPLIKAGFVRICDNKALDFTRKAVAILEGRRHVSKAVGPKVKSNGNACKGHEKNGRQFRPRGNRVIPKVQR